MRTASNSATRHHRIDLAVLNYVGKILIGEVMLKLANHYFDNVTKLVKISARNARFKTRSYAKISTADAITVVHSPRLSPTADCVTFAVRTILLEMR
jgi:hypothetical protein